MRLTTLLLTLLIAPVAFWALATSAGIVSIEVTQALRTLFMITGLTAPLIGAVTLISGVIAKLREKHREDYSPSVFLLAFLDVLSPFWLLFLFAAGGR